MSAEAEANSGTEHLEVVEDEAGDWAVRSRGEDEVLTRHDSREQAEKAARLHSHEQIGTDVRQDIFTNDPEQAVRSNPAPVAVAAIALAALVTAIVVIA